jgi:acyl CoA:acetate/3-ketoacid CoA transferase
MAMPAILVMSARLSFVSVCLKSFPQLGQNGSVGFAEVGLHVGQGWGGFGFFVF